VKDIVRMARAWLLCQAGRGNGVVEGEGYRALVNGPECWVRTPSEHVVFIVLSLCSCHGSRLVHRRDVPPAIAGALGLAEIASGAHAPGG
jgi:hypothetical protein